MIQERIIQYIENKGLSKYKFYNETGISNGFLNKKGAIRTDKFEKILVRYPDISPEWLLTGKGSMLKSEEVNEPTATYATLNRLKIDPIQESQSVPYYDIGASASNVINFGHIDKESIVDRIRIPNMPSCDGAISVQGESMYPIIKSGDIVIYKNTSKENIIFGEMYLVQSLLGGDYMLQLKYINKSDDPTKVTLSSENKRFEAVDVLLDGIISLALIKASIKYNFIN